MQLALPVKENTENQFRDLYYYLYSNSSSSRSERILADLSKLILASICESSGLLRKEIDSFVSGVSSANDVLLPALKKIYPSAVKENETFSLDDASLRHSYMILRDIDLVSSPSHTFGDAFQALMGPRLRGDKGQFFTPRSVVRCLTDLLAPSSGMRVIDPACGTGGFISAVLDAWKRQGVKGHVFGVDKDSDLALLASALSTVHAKNGDVSIVNANSLNLSDLKESGVEIGTFDLAITNPPFGAKIGITDRPTLEQFELGHVWEQKEKAGSWKKADLVRSTQDPQVLFIELCVMLLRNGGRLGIVLPEGIFGNARSGYIWDYLRQNGEIEALIDCPRTTFQPGTDTKTNILIFRKDAAIKENAKDVWISVAYTCGHDKRGRSTKANGEAVSDDFEAISNDWKKAEKARSIWNKTKISDPYYLVPRYYDQKLSDDVSEDAKRLGASVVTLGALMKSGAVTVRKGHEVGSEAYGTGEIPFFRTSDIHNFEVATEPTNCISRDIYEQYADQQNLKAGDILMVVDGRYKIGRCAILHDWNKECVVQSHLKILSVSNPELVSPYALLYGLSLPSVQVEIRRLVFIQSTLGGLGQRIKEIRLPDPRTFKNWGVALDGFEDAIKQRARHAEFLSSFGNEVEL